MRECLSCKGPIPESRRKNALYCERPACRAREYRRRKRELAQASASNHVVIEHTHAQHGSLIITCSCGNQLLVQVSQIGREAKDLHESKQPPDPVTRNRTQQEPSTEPLSVSTPSLPVAPPVPAVPPEPDASLRTYELYGWIAGNTVPLSRVLSRRASGRIDVAPDGEVRVATRPAEGFGLAGTPGRWREHYPNQSPTVFGLDENTAVMAWDERQNRGLALPASDLETLLGRRWKERLLDPAASR